MMYSAAPAYHSPTITWTAAWPYNNTFPDPLTIELACEHLVPFAGLSAYGRLTLGIMDMPGW